MENGQSFRKHLVIHLRTLKIRSIQWLKKVQKQSSLLYFLLFNYFNQLFAQVTNPPIDAIREEIVTSTSVYLGNDGNILEEKPENCHVLRINNPILTNTDILKIKNMKVQELEGSRSSNPLL